MRSSILRVVPWLLVMAGIYTYRTLYSFDNKQGTTLALTLADAAALYISAVVINRLVIPRLLYKRKLFLFLLLLVLLMVGYSYIVQYVQLAWYRYRSPLPQPVLDVFNSFTYQVFNTWLVAFLGFLAICLYRLLGDHYRSQLKYEELLREKAETELNFLKAQINPHFLFNSINSVYGSIHKDNIVARDTLLKFSELLRYQLYECNANTVDIGKEIKYLVNFVELQKLRKEENLITTLTIASSVKSFEIAPLLFIPFVENAFKYVSSHEQSPNEISISIDKNNDVVIFALTNTTERNQQREVMEAGGIGINNVRRRLELLYPGRHELVVRNVDGLFRVTLKIDIA